MQLILGRSPSREIGLGAVGIDALARAAFCVMHSAFALWPGEPPFAPTGVVFETVQTLFRAKHQKHLEAGGLDFDFSLLLGEKVARAM
jgi:hypothetical protein